MTISADRIKELLKNDELYIETDLTRAQTDAYCEERAPWRVNFEFSTGTRTDAYERHDFIFNPRPLGKLRMFSNAIDLTQFEGASVLDIGFNEGYHSVFFSKYLGCDVDGIDVTTKSIERVGAFMDFIDVEANLQLGDANNFCRPGKYDLILHLGTLYHLQDVWGATQASAESLKPGGYLFLETITYPGGANEFDCRFINNLNRGQKNYWALSKAAIADMFEQHGVHHVADVRDIEVKLLKDSGMVRSLQIFRKDED